jgi:hypothetical protein
VSVRPAHAYSALWGDGAAASRFHAGGTNDWVDPVVGIETAAPQVNRNSTVEIRIAR